MQRLALLASVGCAAVQGILVKSDVNNEHANDIWHDGPHKDGLPIDQGPRPSWLLKQDELIIDARKEKHGGMLILQPVLADAGGYWGQEKENRPRWLRSILATNRNHARKHGHAMIMRWKPTEPQVTTWQKADCNKKSRSDSDCVKDWERENFNWEKHLMLYEYLLSDQKFTHVLMLDADAALVKHDVSILGVMEKELNDRHLDVFLTNEDWLQHGEQRINGGVIMAKNTEFSQNLFQDTFASHVSGPVDSKWRIGVKDLRCTSNEQICLNDILAGKGKAIVKDRMGFGSGIWYNRGGCTMGHCGEAITDMTMESLRLKDPRLHIIHFMGGSKGVAAQALCDGEVDLTGEGPTGYGCEKDKKK
eukprot:gb/GFBE01009124.1/.p1 GENE.gb/GFBE01009124.1/~~gb/GFBE01009124.1/.p1  ORF type:complete len:363 (+),score=99.54 gb/GFBE01009124.1/:1-1089(+)